MGQFLRAYLRLLAVLTIASGVGLLAMPAQLGALTPWGAAAGWQREIAFWNLATYIVIVRTLRRGDVGAMRLLAGALVVLNFLVAGNHFATLLASGGAPLNIVAGAINAGSGIFGLIALWQLRDSAATRISEVAED
jgi:KinB signaling pathway activation protein